MPLSENHISSTEKPIRLPDDSRYEILDRRNLPAWTVAAWVSRDQVDDVWDAFLQQTPLGQYQQSTIWARTKSVEGWTPVRVVLTIDEIVVGGFQILRRQSWRGRIGYISKGPIVPAGLKEYASDMLERVSRLETITGIVIQPPDFSATDSRVTGDGSLPLKWIGVNEATWIVDLRSGFATVEQGMRRETRRKSRQAVDRGITVREGSREDIGTFFDLMLSTCRRQDVEPVPADIRTIYALWDASRPANAVRLTFAEWEGKPLAGQIDICFGRTVTQWKKGWTSTESKRFPNDLLTHRAIEWAVSNGFEWFDFSAFDKSMAVTILEGRSPPAQLEASRFFFLTRWGGAPYLLPDARIYFPNRLLRLAYRALVRDERIRPESSAQPGR